MEHKSCTYTWNLIPFFNILNIFEWLIIGNLSNSYSKNNVVGMEGIHQRQKKEKLTLKLRKSFILDTQGKYFMRKYGSVNNHQYLKASN